MEQVAAGVGCFGFIFDPVRKCRFDCLTSAPIEQI